MSTGLPVLLAGLAALEGSLFARALWLFLAGTVVSGVAVGLVYRSGLSEISRLAEPAHRVEAISAFFAAAYVGISLPVVLIGLISVLISTVDASAWGGRAAGRLDWRRQRDRGAHLRQHGPGQPPVGDDRLASVGA